MVPANNSKDILELARSQLDFAAIASDAPSTKEILFKAQTMVPISPFKAWRRIAAATGAVVLLAALLFAPWLPHNASVSLLKISFEQQVSHQDAYSLISHFAREIPRQVLLGAEMSDAKRAGGGGQGYLAIRLSSVSQSPEQLERIADSIAEDSDFAQAYQVLTGRIDFTSWSSPLSELSGLRSHERDAASPAANKELAHSILSHKEVFAKGLKGQLGQLDRRLTDFGFIGAKSGEADRYDFVLDCWPADVGVSVEHYQDLMDHEQSAIRQRSAEYLETFNLRNEGLARVVGPQLWLPIVVDVYERDASYNPQLTSRLQAWIEQPDALELASLDFDALECVRAALDHVIPENDYRLDYVRSSGPSSNTTRVYKVKVTVLGARERGPERMSIPAIQDNPELEY
jgi:hypothetical protein